MSLHTRYVSNPKTQRCRVSVESDCSFSRAENLEYESTEWDELQKKAGNLSRYARGVGVPVGRRRHRFRPEGIFSQSTELAKPLIFFCFLAVQHSAR